MKKTIVLLNADMSILTFISFPRAIGLYMQNKASIIDSYDYTVHPSLDIRYPKTMMLKRYIYIPYKKVKVSRQNIFLRDKNTCQYCGKQLKGRDATIDHVIPKTHKDFPGNLWTNLVACCFKCNNKKDNKTPQEAGMMLLHVPYEPKLEDLI